MTSTTNDTWRDIREILSQKEDFIIIGLTGRMGSGCSSIADYLSKSYNELNIPNPIPQTGSTSLTDEERLVRIIAEYGNAHWLKFEILRVRSIISAFVLTKAGKEQFITDLRSFIDDPLQKDHAFDEFQEKLLQSFQQQTDIWETEIEEETKSVANELLHLCGNKNKYEEDIEVLKGEMCLGEKSFCEMQNSLCTRSGSLARSLDRLYRYANSDACLKTHTRRKYIEVVDAFLEKLAQNYTIAWVNEYGNSKNGLWNRLVEISNEFPGKTSEDSAKKHATPNDGDQRKSKDKLCNYLTKFKNGIIPSKLPMDNASSKSSMAGRHMQHSKTISEFEKFVYVRYLSVWFGDVIHEYLDRKRPGAFTRLFQKYGQMIRDHGNITEVDAPRTSGDVFEIPRKINRYIKVLRHPFDTDCHRPVRVAIDSIKNIFEATYLRYRYSAFYLWGITAKDDVRKDRLGRKHLNDLQIRFMDWNEYPAEGRAAFLTGQRECDSESKDEANRGQHKIQKHKKDIPANDRNQKSNEYKFYIDPFEANDVAGANGSPYLSFRKKAYEKKLYTFIMQDVESCIDNSDVFIFTEDTTGTDAAQKIAKLKVNILRNVLLIMYPCLIRPTPIERCMQIAFSAKVNSGCLSRQVGAVVTDSKFNILAIGWNDVPKGEVPCAYRNLLDVAGNADSAAYSKFENIKADFRNRATKLASCIGHWNIEFSGLPCSYCFKDVHQKSKDAMRSRAMHAEEKALALCGDKAEGGYLFTTSSPCEMCSKNAKNHGIKKIFYIESYPGIAAEQYTESGDPQNRAELVLFTGAVGRAYMQMYTPLMPHKDVLAYMGFDPHKLLGDS